MARLILKRAYTRGRFSRRWAFVRDEMSARKVVNILWATKFSKAKKQTGMNSYRISYYCFEKRDHVFSIVGKYPVGERYLVFVFWVYLCVLDWILSELFFYLFFSSFFSDTTKRLFESCCFDVLQNTYVFKRTVNKKEEIDVPRVFVQGKFKKTAIPSWRHRPSFRVTTACC